MPLRMALFLRNSTTTLTSSASAPDSNSAAKKLRNKLYRRRPSSAVPVMTVVVAGGDEDAAGGGGRGGGGSRDGAGVAGVCGTPAESVPASDTPTLLNFGKHEDKEKDQEKETPGEKDARMEKGDHPAFSPLQPPSLSHSKSEQHQQQPLLLHRNNSTAADDPQTQVIQSLRMQIEELISQVTQLNGKLVKSYDRVSNLEDELHLANTQTRSSALRIADLEVERSQHVAALTTGLYVERAHVTAELTRLMERATAEAAARGQAESARAEIEGELDDLSANLFAQANTMVAEARLAGAASERKAGAAERALRSAEEALAGMQLQLQMIRDEKERTADEAARLRVRMEKGKFVGQTSGASVPTTTAVKLLKAIMPYHEFLHFIAHLRSLRLAVAQSAPTISTLLTLPFLARLQTEDSEPTLRLDFAPSLNWLSRRSILSAVCCGQLNIEPVPVSTLLLEPGSTLQSMIPGNNHRLSCALCGVDVFTPKPEQGQRPQNSFSRNTSGSWSTSFFKNPLSNSVTAAPSPPLTPPLEDSTVGNGTGGPGPLTTVHVFSISAPQGQTSFQNNSQGQNATPKYTNYPLCSSGWCLARLRTTCSLWAFVRVGIIDRVWEETASRTRTLPVGAAKSISSGSAYSGPSPHQSTETGPKKSSEEIKKTESTPPTPSNRRSKVGGMSVGSLWNIASGALRSQSQTNLMGSNKQKDTTAQSVPKARASTETPPPLPTRISVDTNVPKSSATQPQTLPSRGEKRQSSSATDSRSPTLPECDNQKSANGRENGVENKTFTGDAKSVATDKTLVLNRLDLPPPVSVQASMSMASSVLSGANDEFSTPVEELPNMNLPSVPNSPLQSRRSSRSSPVSPPPLRPPRSPSRPRSRPSSRSESDPAPFPSSPRFSRHSMSPPPLSPRMAPLPDSRPGSPLNNPHSTRESRSDSGAVSVAPLNIGMTMPSLRAARESTTNLTRSLPPSGPRPPPVPKRAAARLSVQAAPGSTSGTGSAASPSAPMAAEEAQQSMLASVDAGNKTSEWSPSPSSSPGVRSSEESNVREPPSLPQRRESAATVQSPKLAEATVPSNDFNDSEGSIMAFSEDVRRRMEKTQARAKAEAEGHNGVAGAPELMGTPSGGSVDAEEGKCDMNENANAGSNAVATKDARADTIANGETKTKEAADANVHVGDGSWEERTWREIMRLREEMFWARCGAVRG